MANTTFSLGGLAGDPRFDFISHFAGSTDHLENNNFDYTDSPYTSSNFSTTYMDISTYMENYNSNQNLKLLSLNIQSLPAKFNELNSLIISLLDKNCAPDVIALQEIWQVLDASHFPLPGYLPLIFTTRSKGTRGGCGHLLKKWYFLQNSQRKVNIYRKTF